MEVLALDDKRWKNQYASLWARSHSQVNLRIKKGLLKRGSCIICGKPDAHAHHEDHYKYLDITWLCPRHHTMLHNLERSGHRKDALEILMCLKKLYQEISNG